MEFEFKPHPLTVLVDDFRDLGADLVIRNSFLALPLLENLGKNIETLLMDNDMGRHRPEGYWILNKYLNWCKEQDYYPRTVFVVTDNVVASGYMKQSLERHGYTEHPGRQFIHHHPSEEMAHV